MEEDYEQDIEENNKKSGSPLKDLFEANKKILIIVGLILLIIIFSSLKGCSGGNTPSQINIELMVEKEEFDLQINSGEKIKPYLNNNRSDSNGVYEYKSENDSIVIVDNYGNLKAVSLGNTKVVVTYKENNQQYTKEVKINVIEGDKSVVLNDFNFPNDTLIIGKGTEFELSYLLEPNNGYVENKMYSSSDTYVVSFREDNNYLIANNIGTAEVTLRMNGNITKTLKVKVVDRFVEPKYVKGIERFEFETKEISVLEGESLDIAYKLYPEDAYKDDLIWESSDNNVCTVNNGYLIANKEGIAVVTVKEGNVDLDKITVNVKKDVVKVTGLNIDPTGEIELEVGSVRQIIPKVAPENATNKNVTYQSTIPGVAGVSSTGLITALSQGTTTIIVTTEDGKFNQTLLVRVLNSSGGTDPGYDPSTDPGTDPGTNPGGDTCTDLVKVTTNSSDYTSTGKGALASNTTSGNADVFESRSAAMFKFTVESINCQTENLKYCVSTSGSECEPNIIISSGESKTVYLSNTNGSTKIMILKFADATGKSKTYSMKYKIDGSGGTTPTNLCTRGQEILSINNSYFSKLQTSNPMVVSSSSKNVQLKLQLNSECSNLTATYQYKLTDTSPFKQSVNLPKNSYVSIPITGISTTQKRLTLKITLSNGSIHTYYLNYKKSDTTSTGGGTSTPQITHASFQASYVKSKSEGGVLNIGATTYGLHTLTMTQAKDIDKVYFNIGGNVDMQTATSSASGITGDGGKTYSKIEVNKTYMLNASNFSSLACYEYTNNGSTVKYNFAVKNLNLKNQVIRITVVYKDGSKETKRVTVS